MKEEEIWTAEQVDTLNAYQRKGQFHPFTCPHRDDRHNERWGDLGTLIATPFGFLCPDCAHRQAWGVDHALWKLPKDQADDQNL